jgi:hypothetical protein
MAGTPPTLPPLSFGPFVNQADTLTIPALNFLQQLWTAAFAGGGVTPGVFLLGYSDNINFNVAGDKPITLTVPGGTIGWRAALGVVFGTSGSFSTAKAGIYSLPFTAGATLLGQTALSGITATGVNTAGALTTALTPVQTAIWNYKTIYLNVGTAQGGASLGNFYLYGYPVY